MSGINSIPNGDYLVLQTLSFVFSLSDFFRFVFQAFSLNFVLCGNSNEMPPFISKLVAHQRLLDHVRKLLDVVILQFLSSADHRFDPYNGLTGNSEAMRLVSAIMTDITTITGQSTPPEGTEHYTDEQIQEFYRLQRCMTDIRTYLGPEREQHRDAVISSFIKALLENRTPVE